MSLVKLALRVVLVTAIVAYFVVAAGLLVTRYYVLPRIDQWRPDIEQALSQAVGTPVKFDAITADWYGLNANLTLSNLRILDDQGVAQLGIPNTQAIVSWRSLLSLQPVFRYIGVEDVIVVARRAPDGSVYVGGFDVSSDDDDTSFWQSATMRWLLAQGRLNVEDSRLVVVDQQAGSVPLVFQDIDITADNGLLGHQLDVRLTLPQALGGRLEMAAQIDSVAGSLSRFLVDEPDGYVYASIDEFYPQAFGAWVPVPDVQGSFATRLWLDVQGGQFTNFSVTVAGRDAAFAAHDKSADGAAFEQFQWRANGPLAAIGLHEALPDVVKTGGSLSRVSSSLTVANGQLRLPSAGMNPIDADQLSAQVSVGLNGPDDMDVRVQDLTLANADGLVTARGSWRLDAASADRAGVLDVQGTIARFHLFRLFYYMPNTVDADARQWMARAFKFGRVPRASFQVKGAVDDFPYGGAGQTGTFSVNGNVQDVTIDYANEPGDEGLPWPVLTDLNGTLDLLNDRIGLDVSAGALTLPKGQRVTLGEMSGKLVDFESNPVLTLNGQTAASAQTYLALFDDTALKDIAPAFVSEFSGKGDWEMPLSLKVPLNELEQTTFEGRLALNGGELAYATSPALTNVQGVALLSDKGFEADGLSATVLGGEVKLSGGVNDKLDTIKATGKLSWQEVGKYTQSGLVEQLLSGDLSYEVTAKVQEGGFDVSVVSDLAGTGISLPAPLGLSAPQTAATEISFKGSAQENQPDVWRASVANRLSLSANSSASGAPFFSGMQLAIGSAKPLSGSGLTVAAQLPSLNLDEWMPVIDKLRGEMADPTPGESSALPSLKVAQIKAGQLIMGANKLDDVTADLTVEQGRQYSVKLGSAQTNGEVHWALDNGKLQDGFHVRLDRLAIGSASSTDATDKAKADKKTPSALPEPGQLSDLPALDIEIKDLSLYGARLGSFKIRGKNSADNKQWQISQLDIINPHGQLKATGYCRFDSNPGVKLDAEMQISDLGAMVQYLVQGNEVRKGRGTIKANINWERLPWQFDYAGLSGTAELDLQEGVFDHVSSDSARVLELLSMQSLNRLLSANINPDESFAQGFPWSSITGTFDITKGVVDSQNLTVNSPVATISLEGDSSLVDETWDLRAVVRPNLDMSGTALATGFLVNPIVGLSALVGQYLLRNPVESALSQRFTVGGTWDKPVISDGSGDANQSGQSSGSTSGSNPNANSQSQDSSSANKASGETEIDTSDLQSGN